MRRFRRPVFAALAAALIAAAAVAAAWIGHAPDRATAAAVAAARQAAAIEDRDRAIIAEARIRDDETCDAIAVAGFWVDAADHADVATVDGRHAAGSRYEAAMERILKSRPYNPTVARAHDALRAAVVAVTYDPTATGTRETATAAAAMSRAACATYTAGQHK